MIINISDKLEKDVNAYCKANDINDIDAFIVSCFKQGFDIARYGIKPFANDVVDKPQPQGRKVKIVKK